MMITRTGIELGVASVILACLGIAAGYPELVLLAAAGAAALAVATSWVARLRLRLAVSRSITPEQPRAGQTVSVQLLVTNRAKRPSPVLLAGEKVGDSAFHLEIPPIKPGKECPVTYQVPAVRRGRLWVEPARVGRRDPLGWPAPP
jgi:uncharacterized protein (DUF58 family)